MKKNTIIIVGAGIAGLSTGCYAQMNGYQSTIFEMHTIPGGLCTAWKRKGYTFDLSMHFLVGSKSGAFYRMWQELGMMENLQFHYHDEIAYVEGLHKSLSICADPQRLLDQLIALSPADAKLSREFVRLVSGRGIMGAASLKSPELSGMFDNLKMILAVLPQMGMLRRCGNKTFQEFVQGFQDSFLRDAVRCFGDAPDWPMQGFPLSAMAGLINATVTEAGVPLGGSQKAVFKIAEKYQELGGEIRYKQRVTDILIENDRAVGIRLEDGSEHRADIVVWAADGHTAIFDILGGRYLDDKIRKMYEEWTVVQPLVHVSLGVARDLSAQPYRYIFELEEPLRIAGQERRWLSLRHRCFDPSMAPPGKSAAEVWYPTSYAYWEELARDRARYEDEKKRIAEATIAALDKRWSGFAAQIEVVDVATPMTYVRYTGNWQGSPDGWYITTGNMMEQTPARSLAGLSDFYMVGQWTAPFAGTVISALSGRQLIEVLCKHENRAFVTSG
ncbi:MAG: phytoene desaturase family protein [Anaerolineae bacterium]